MIFRDKYGWPIERVKGHRIRNAIRLLVLTDIKLTLARRNETIDAPVYIRCKVDYSDWRAIYGNCAKDGD